MWQPQKVGICEFREKLVRYLESKMLVAIGRHGATIGIYVPSKPNPRQAAPGTLRVAGAKIQQLIAAVWAAEGEIVADFKKARRDRRHRG